MTPAFDKLRAYRGGYASSDAQGQCEKHGPFDEKVYFEDDVEVGRIGYCQPCSEAKREAERIEQERADAHERFQRRVEAAQIPPAFALARFTNYQLNDASKASHAAVHAFAKDFRAHRKSGRSLTLLGRPGTGKTHLAIAALWAVLATGYSGRYVTLSELVRTIRATWRRDSYQREAEAISQFTDPSILVLDEVGVAQSGSENELGLIAEIIDSRYRAQKPTIVVGNVTFKQLEAFLGERAVDRLCDHGGQVLAMSWASYRRTRPATTSGPSAKSAEPPQ